MFLGLCVFSREQEGDEDWGRVSGAGGRDREGLTQSWVISRKRRLCPVGRVGVYGSGCLGRRGRVGYRRKEKRRDKQASTFMILKRSGKVPTPTPITSCIIAQVLLPHRSAITARIDNSEDVCSGIFNIWVVFARRRR